MQGVHQNVRQMVISSWRTSELVLVRLYARFMRLSTKVRVGIMLAAALFINICWMPLNVFAGCPANNVTHMYLLWDLGSGYGTSAPTDWSFITSYNGDFIRGDTVANALTTGGTGTRPFTPTINSTTVSVPSATIAENTNANGTAASSVHTHAVSVSLSSDSNGDLPAYRTLELMEYTPAANVSNCIPQTIPAGAIAFFQNTPPAGFSAYTTQNNQMIALDSTIYTGGGDTVTNNVCYAAVYTGCSVGTSPGNIGTSTDVSGSTAAVQPNNFLPNTATIAKAHNHTLPNTAATTAVTGDPPYIQPVLGQATANIATIGVNMIGLFDGDPGASWSILSGSGGAYNGQFMRPSSTYSQVSQGTSTHTDPNYVTTTGAASGTNPGNTLDLGLGGNGASSTHTHTITTTFNSVSNVPPYVNFVFAQKVSFILNAYRWYVDSGSQNVTDPWPTGSGLDIAQDTTLPAIPAQYIPPDANAGTQLRLRVQILVGAQPVAVNSTSFKVQWLATSNNDCLSGSWTDVAASNSTSQPWRYGTNAMSDPTALSAPSPATFSPASNVYEVFSRSASTAGTPTAAASGNTMEYDWLIQNYSAQSGTNYYFRVIETNGTAFGSYFKNGTSTPECPGVTTAPSTDQELRHGEFFLTNPGATTDPDQGFEWAN